MRTDAPYLHARFKNIERQDKPWTARQLSEMEALNNILFGDPYNWITPSMFDPDAQRLRDKYPAAGTTRIRWMMDEETITRVTGDMRTSDFEIGYTKSDHLSYAYGDRGHRKIDRSFFYGGKMSDMLKQLPTKEEAERQVQAWRDAYPHARFLRDEIDLTSTPVTLSPEGEAAPLELPQWKEPEPGAPRLSFFRDDHLGRANSIHVEMKDAPEDTLAEEIKADVERVAKLAANTPPGFIQYEEAKKQGLVDEDPWPTTEEILAAHAAKHYADGLREDAERDLARIEARNAFKVALRKSAITASLVMIGGVALCIAVGLIGALIYSAFNFFLPRLGGSETAANIGGVAVIFLVGTVLGLLLFNHPRR